MPDAAQNIIVDINASFTEVINVVPDIHHRIVIPAHHVNQGASGDCTIVEDSTGGYNFLTVYTPVEFAELTKKRLLQGNVSEDDYKDKKRLFFGGVKSQKLNPTKPRLTLDEDMIDYLNITREGITLCLVGAGDSLEIWRRDEYDAWKKGRKVRVG